MEILLLLVFYFLGARQISLVVHELGHAVPGLLFFEGRHELFIGSLGEKENSWQLKAGRLDIFIKKTIHIQSGLFKVGTPHDAAWKNTLLVLGGPLFSLLFGLSITFLLLYTLPGPGFNEFLMALVGAAVFDFLITLVPGTYPSKNSPNDPYASDGLQLQMMAELGKHANIYHEANVYYHQKEYEKAEPLLDALLLSTQFRPLAYILAVSNAYQLNNFEKALQRLNEYEEKTTLSTELKGFKALLVGLKGDYETSMELFEKVLTAFSIDAPKGMILNNRAYIKIRNEEYESALNDLDEAVEYGEVLDYVYLNRARALMMLGKVEMGRANIDKSREYKSEKDEFYYFSMGIYHCLKKEKAPALASFAKAQEMDPHLDELSIWEQKLKNLDE